MLVYSTSDNVLILHKTSSRKIPQSPTIGVEPICLKFNRRLSGAFCVAICQISNEYKHFNAEGSRLCEIIRKHIWSEFELLRQVTVSFGVMFALKLIQITQ